MEGNPQDSHITSSQDDTITHEVCNTNVSKLSVLVEEMGTGEGLKITQFIGGKDNQKKSNNYKTFPWLKSFHKLCRSAIGLYNLKLLTNLMTLFIQNVSRDVANSYLKPRRAAKLKDSINETLIFFHMYYSNLKKPMEQSKYLDQMSDLMAMYMDMEIKASRRGKESLKKVTSKLSSALYILLNGSVDHILESILKTKFFVRSFREICIPILKHVLSPTSPDINEMTYVRRIIIFKLWKRLVQSTEERKRINKMASSITPPPRMIDMLRCGLLASVLPPIPRNKNQSTVTRFLIMAKLNLRKTIKAFLKISRDPKHNDLASAFDKSRFFRDCQIDDESPPNKETEDRSSQLIDSIWKSVSNPQPELTNCTPISAISGTKKKDSASTLKGNKKKCKNKKAKCNKKKEKKIKAKSRNKNKNKSINKVKSKNKEVFSAEFEEMLKKMKLETTNAKNSHKVNIDSCVKKLKENSNNALSVNILSEPSDGLISTISIPTTDESKNKSTSIFNNNIIKSDSGVAKYGKEMAYNESEKDASNRSVTKTITTTDEEKENIIQSLLGQKSREMCKLENTTKNHSIKDNVCHKVIEDLECTTKDYNIMHSGCSKVVNSLETKTNVNNIKYNACSFKEVNELQSKIEDCNINKSDSFMVMDKERSKIDSHSIVYCNSSMRMDNLGSKIEDCSQTHNDSSMIIEKMKSTIEHCSIIHSKPSVLMDTLEKKIDNSPRVVDKLENEIENCSIIHNNSFMAVDKLNSKIDNGCSMFVDKLKAKLDNCPTVMDKVKNNIKDCIIMHNDNSTAIEKLESKVDNSSAIVMGKLEGKIDNYCPIIEDKVKNIIKDCSILHNSLTEVNKLKSKLDYDCATAVDKLEGEIDNCCPIVMDKEKKIEDCSRMHSNSSTSMDNYESKINIGYALVMDKLGEEIENYCPIAIDKSENKTENCNIIDNNSTIAIKKLESKINNSCAFVQDKLERNIDSDCTMVMVKLEEEIDNYCHLVKDNFENKIEDCNIVHDNSSTTMDNFETKINNGSSLVKDNLKRKIDNDFTMVVVKLEEEIDNYCHMVKNKNENKIEDCSTMHNNGSMAMDNFESKINIGNTMIMDKLERKVDNYCPIAIDKFENKIENCSIIDNNSTISIEKLNNKIDNGSALVIGKLETKIDKCCPTTMEKLENKIADSCTMVIDKMEREIDNCPRIIDQIKDSNLIGGISSTALGKLESKIEYCNILEVESSEVINESESKINNHPMVLEKVETKIEDTLNKDLSLVMDNKLEGKIEYPSILQNESSVVRDELESKIVNDYAIIERFGSKIKYDTTVDSDSSLLMDKFESKIKYCNTLQNVSSVVIDTIKSKCEDANIMHNVSSMMKDNRGDKIKDHITFYNDSSMVMNNKLKNTDDRCSILHNDVLVIDKVGSTTSECNVMHTNNCSMVLDKVESTAENCSKLNSNLLENKIDNDCAVVMDKLGSAMEACNITNRDCSDIVEHCNISHSCSICTIDKSENNSMNVLIQASKPNHISSTKDEEIEMFYDSPLIHKVNDSIPKTTSGQVFSTLVPTEFDNYNNSVVSSETENKCQTVIVEAESSSNKILEVPDVTFRQNSNIKNGLLNAVVGINNNVNFAEKFNCKDELIGSPFIVDNECNSPYVLTNKSHLKNCSEFDIQNVLNQKNIITNYSNDIYFNNKMEKDNFSNTEAIASCSDTPSKEKVNNNISTRKIKINHFQDLKRDLEDNCYKSNIRTDNQPNKDNIFTESIVHPKYNDCSEISSLNKRGEKLYLKSGSENKFTENIMFTSRLDNNILRIESSEYPAKKNLKSCDIVESSNSNSKLGKKGAKDIKLHYSEDENKIKSQDLKQKLNGEGNFTDLNKMHKIKSKSEANVIIKRRSSKNKTRDSINTIGSEFKVTSMSHNSSLSNKKNSKNVDFSVTQLENVEYICTKEPNSSNESLRIKIQRCNVKDTNNSFENSQDLVKVKNDVQPNTKVNHKCILDYPKQDDVNRTDVEKQSSIISKNVTSLSTQCVKTDMSIKVKNSKDYMDISEKVFVKTSKKNGVTKLVQLPMKNAVFINIENDEKLRKEVQIKVHKLRDNVSKDYNKVENNGVPEFRESTSPSKKLSSLVNSMDLSATSVGSLIKKGRSCKEENMLSEEDLKFKKIHLNHKNDEVNSEVKNLLQLKKLKVEPVKKPNESIQCLKHFEPNPKINNTPNSHGLNSYEVKSDVENAVENFSSINHTGVNSLINKPVENITQLNSLQIKSKFAKPIDQVQQLNSYEVYAKIRNPLENHSTINIPQMQSKVKKYKTESLSQSIFKGNNFESKSITNQANENALDTEKCVDVKYTMMEGHEGLHSKFNNSIETICVNGSNFFNSAKKEIDLHNNNMSAHDNYLLSDQLSVPNTFLNIDKSSKEDAALKNLIYSSELYLPPKLNSPNLISLNTRDHVLQNQEQSTTNRISSLIDLGYGQVEEVNLSTKGSHTSPEFNMSAKDDCSSTKVSVLANKLYSQPVSIKTLSGSTEFSKSNVNASCGLNAFTPQLRQFVTKDNIVFRIPDDSIVKIPTESTFKTKTSLKVDTPYITSNNVNIYSEPLKGLQKTNSETVQPDTSALCLVVDKNVNKDDDFEMNLCTVAQEIEICSAPEGFGTNWGYALPEVQDREHGEEWVSRTGIEENLILDSCTSQKYSQGLFTTPNNDIYFSSSTPKSAKKCLKRKHGDFEKILKDLSKLEQISADLTFSDSLDPDKLTLHLRTVDSDFIMCSSQHKFKEYYLSHQDVPPAIPVPYPPQVPSDNFRTLVRCPCLQCCDNRCILVSNYNKLTQYRNAKVKLDLDPRFCPDDTVHLLDKDHNTELDCSLPLKKRKTLTQLPKSAEQDIPSYPNTPMISIAELELTNFKPTTRVIVPNPQTQSLQNSTSEIALQPKYNPDRPGWRFKTPAQLKEHPVPTNDMALAAHNLINFAQCTLRQYMDEGDTQAHRKQSKKRKHSMRHFSRPNELRRYRG